MFLSIGVLAPIPPVGATLRVQFERTLTPSPKEMTPDQIIRLPRIRRISNTVSPAAGRFKKSGSWRVSDVGKWVVIVEDNRDQAARHKSGKAVTELLKRDLIDLVAVEGWFGSKDLPMIKQFNCMELVRDVADHLIRQNRISDPVHAALTDGKTPLFIDLDTSPNLTPAEQKAVAVKLAAMLNTERASVAMLIVRASDSSGITRYLNEAGIGSLVFLPS